MKKCINNMRGNNRSKKNGQQETGETVSKRTRTTISIPDDLHAQGVKRARGLRRGSFSNYVENLIADDVGEAVPA